MNINHFLVTIISFLFFIPPSYSQSKSNLGKKKIFPKIQSSKQMEIIYGSSSWNKNSTQIDSAFLFVRDKVSKRVVKISLEESEPDSSVFSGQFLLHWGESKIAPEVFIPPQKLRKNTSDIENFNRLLIERKIKRRPIVFRRDKTGKATLDVYDTKKQALSALKAYNEKVKREKELAQQKKSLIKPIPTESELEAERIAKIEAELAKLALEAAKREQERVRQEQIEKQKIEEEKRRQKQLAKAERERRKKEAIERANEALTLYKASRFVEAEKKFRESISLDPENYSYYFKYAVTLYRNQKFNEALIIFNITKVSKTEELEKNFYEGLIHFRLKEIDKALEKFNFVQSKNNKFLSPSAAFYVGLIHFNREGLKKAKPAFEYVLDHSTDPKLDQKAEDYIEKILQMEYFKKNQAKKNSLTSSFGLSYDSNILLSPDASGTSTATNVSGGRALAIAGYERRFIYEKTHQLSLKLDSLYMYSFDSAASSADPLTVSTSVPYSYASKLFGKGNKLTLKPGYEILFMDAENTGNRSLILSSILLNTSTTFIMNPQWFAAYNLDFRQDDSLLTISDEDDNSDASKITLSTNQSYFFDNTKKKALISNLGYVMNNATGNNKIYTRIDLGFTYMSNIKRWDSTWTAALNGYSVDYSKTTDKRKDTNYKISFTLSKPFKKWMTGTMTADYTSNNSNVSTNSYSKYTLMFISSFTLDY